MRWFAVSVLVVAVGCLPSAFDDLRGETTIDSNGPFPDVNSNDFPVAIAAVPGIGGLRFVAAGNSPLSVSSYVYLPGDGELRTSGLDVPGLGNDSDPDRPALVGAADDDDNSGLVFLGGLDEANRISVFDAGDGTRPIELVDTILPGDCPDDGNREIENMGFAMVYANTGIGEPAIPELIVAAETSAVVSDLLIFQDYEPGGEKTCLRCLLLDPNGVEYQIHGLAAMELEGATNNQFQQIIMTSRNSRSNALPDDGGFEVFDASAAGASRCFSGAPQPLISLAESTHNSSDTDTNFGRNIAVGDFDGNGQDDIAFTRPESSSVRIQLNPSPGNAGVEATINAPPMSAQIASADTNNSDTDQLIVASPMETVQGVQAGAVLVFDVPIGGQQVGTPIRIHDSSPDSGQRFGRALTVGQFQLGGENVDIIITGGFGEVFTVFALDPNASDPRF